MRGNRASAEPTAAHNLSAPLVFTQVTLVTRPQLGMTMFYETLT